MSGEISLESVADPSLDELTVGLSSVSATAALAGLLAQTLKQGLAIGLSGELGAGKTEFVRQLVGAFRGVAAAECRDVVSPSFMLEAVYDLPRDSAILAVHHWDLYRIAGGALPGDLEEILSDEKLLKLIEWPERVPSLSRLLSLEVMIAFSGLPSVENSLTDALDEPMSERRSCRIRLGERTRSNDSIKSFWNDFHAALKTRLGK